MDDFVEGYKNFSKVVSAKAAVDMGSDYIEKIKDAIEQMTSNINSPSRSITNTPIDSLKGFVAEIWHEGTYNIDTAVRGSRSSAYAPDNNKLTDIFLIQTKRPL